MAGETQDYTFVNAKLSVLNVKAYGARGDGVTDDTTSIQTAINTARDAVRATGMKSASTICIPSGRYEISSTITLPPYIKLAPIGNVIFEWTGGNSTCLWVTPVSTDPEPLAPNILRKQQQLSDVVSGVWGALIILNAASTGSANAPGTGLELGSRADLGASLPLCGYKLSNVAIQGFATGLLMNTYNHYIGVLDHFRIEQNDTCIAIGAGTNVNSGENFVIQNSIISNGITGVSINSPSIQLTFDKCSFDYLSANLISTAYAYLDIAINRGHIESINNTNTATGGIINSTNSGAGSVYLSMDRVNMWHKASRTFHGTNLILSGTVFDQIVNGDSNTVYPNSIRADDNVNATLFRNLFDNGRRIQSKSHNRIADPMWTKEVVNASITALQDWTVVPFGGTTMAMVATTPNSTGNSLKLTIPASGGTTLTYKYDIPVADSEAFLQTACFQTDTLGINISFALSMKDATGTVVQSALVGGGTTAMAANVWNLPDQLTDSASLSMIAKQSATTVKPVVQISNPTAGAINVMIPFIYLGR